MKRVLIISTGPRKGGNSETLAEEFGKGSRDAGHQVEMIALRDKAIGYCKGCLACQATGSCVIHDDANAVTQKMLHADVLVFATPIYFFEMCAQMKTLLDRTNPLFPTDYAFRDIYLVASAAEKEETSTDGAAKGLLGWIACFGKTSLKGVIGACGVTDVGDIQGSPALRQAYEMGRAV